MPIEVYEPKDFKKLKEEYKGYKKPSPPIAPPAVPAHPAGAVGGSAPAPAPAGTAAAPGAIPAHPAGVAGGPAPAPAGTRPVAPSVPNPMSSIDPKARLGDVDSNNSFIRTAGLFNTKQYEVQLHGGKVQVNLLNPKFTGSILIKESDDKFVLLQYEKGAVSDYVDVGELLDTGQKQDIQGKAEELKNRITCVLEFGGQDREGKSVKVTPNELEKHVNSLENCLTPEITAKHPYKKITVKDVRDHYAAPSTSGTPDRNAIYPSKPDSDTLFEMSFKNGKVSLGNIDPAFSATIWLETKNPKKIVGIRFKDGKAIGILGDKNILDPTSRQQFEQQEAEHKKNMAAARNTAIIITPPQEEIAGVAPGVPPVAAGSPAPQLPGAASLAAAVGTGSPAGGSSLVPSPGPVLDGPSASPAGPSKVSRSR